jgi:hypothetical protein
MARTRQALLGVNHRILTIRSCPCEEALLWPRTTRVEHHASRDRDYSFILMGIAFIGAMLIAYSEPLKRLFGVE